MSKIAFLCSGQGSQYAGMGQEFYESFPAIRTIYECGSDIMGFDLANISFHADEATLAQTNHAQPAIFALSMAAYHLVSEFCAPSAFAGHSFGEYAALTSAGAFSLEDGFRVVAARAKVLGEATKSLSGSMYAVIGSDEQTILDICGQTQGYVEPVNYNSPAQTVIAGETDAAASAAQALTDLGVKVVKLSVALPFHTKLLAEASQEFARQISGIPMKPLSKPVYSNVTGGLLAPDVNLAEYLANHMISPVRFHGEVSTMCDDGFDTFVELGPNKVLTMLIKRGFKEATAYNVENCKTLEKLRQSL